MVRWGLSRRDRSRWLLEAAYERHDRRQLARARILLRCHLAAHPRDSGALAFAAMVWLASGRPAAALRLARRSLRGFEASGESVLRKVMEGEALEAGVRAACHLRRTAPWKEREALGRMAQEWLARLVKREPEAAAALADEAVLGDLQEPRTQLLDTSVTLEAHKARAGDWL